MMKITHQSSVAPIQNTRDRDQPWARYARICLVLVLVVTGTGSALLRAQDKKIALTFEEIPYMKPMGFWRPREISNLILRILEKENIKAAGFVVQQKVEDDTSTYVILEDWVTRGHVLGNETWGSADYNELSTEHFMEHAIDGQKYLRKIARAHPFNYRYLRFPQLHEGDTEKKKKDLRKELERGSYKVAPVTVKTFDFLFNRPYVEYGESPETVARLKKLYLDHITRSLEYSEKQSQLVFGQNISHILQLHMGLTTATFLEDVITLLKERGYTFVSFPEALSDPLYGTEETYAGPLGLTFIDRVAATRGIPFEENAGTSRSEIEQQIESIIEPE